MTGPVRPAHLPVIGWMVQPSKIKEMNHDNITNPNT